MKEIITQYNGSFTPSSAEDDEVAHNTYKMNQMVRIKTYAIGAEKQRSSEQLNTVMACCQLVADNTENPQLNSKAKVKFACKVHTDFRDPAITFVSPDGTVQFHYRSFSFDNLKHMEACNLFERCFDFMASLMGIDKDTMIAEAQSKMRKH